MSSQRYDAIVVGAGPGGTTTAYSLARAGLKTLLIEKAKLPRYKTCGGGVTYKAARALPFSIESVTERILYKADFSYRTGRPFVVASREPLVYMVQRSRFDNLLAEQAVRAGAQLMDETPVRSVDMDAHGVSVTTNGDTYSADFLVGADGATGRVARSLGLMSDRQAIPAIESELEAGDDTMSYWVDKLGLDLGTLHASYGWVFPKGEHLSVGVGGFPFMPNFGTRLKEYDEAHTRGRVPSVKRVIATHGYLLPLRRPGAPVQKGRALLVGDAAGLVEAFTGEGIYWAIRSGQLAARSILSNREGVPDYQSMLDKALTPDLIAARRWLHVYFWLPRACYALPRVAPFFWQAVCNIIRGDSHFTDIGPSLGPFSFVERLIPPTLRIGAGG